MNKSKLRTFWGFEVQWLIFLVNVAYNNYMTCTYYVNLIEAIIERQKFLLTCRELPPAAFSYHVTIIENYYRPLRSTIVL